MREGLVETLQLSLRRLQSGEAIAYLRLPLRGRFVAFDSCLVVLSPRRQLVRLLGGFSQAARELLSLSQAAL